jgi:protein gp37
MAENSAIEWTDATFNPWWGCAEVSPGCKNCYARSLAHRLLPRVSLWDVNGDRRLFGHDHWRGPIRWERKAVKEGRRLKVFCASMADVFDNNDMLVSSRLRLWQLIRATPHLDWLILTKRIGNAKEMLPADWGGGYANVWLGASIVNQVEANRDIPKLLATPAAIRFLSCEPLLGPIRFVDRWDHIDWIIVGGESGHGARPMDREWADFIRAQCAASGTAFFMKQGSQANWPTFKDFASFPTYLQVREWPRDSYRWKHEGT